MKLTDEQFLTLLAALGPCPCDRSIGRRAWSKEGVAGDGAEAGAIDKVLSIPRHEAALKALGEATGIVRAGYSSANLIVDYCIKCEEVGKQMEVAWQDNHHGE